LCPRPDALDIGAVALAIAGAVALVVGLAFIVFWLV
jgi:hypothetical protein